VTLVKVTADGPDKVQSAEYFAGKKVALFAVPGAFTPTCSAKHLPGYVEKAAELKAKGVDEIACTSVNDAFVLGAWNKSGGSDDITMLADGNGDFAKRSGPGCRFQRLRHGQAQPALFADRQRWRGRGSERGRPGRIQGLQRGAHARPAVKPDLR
jgi:glutaredoxin/glutathione-dependent peroxiredoxin